MRVSGMQLGALALTLTALTGCAEQASVEAETPSFRVTHRKADTTRRARSSDEASIEVDVPALPVNASCRQARAAYVEQWELEAGDIPPDLSRGQLSSVLVSGRYVQRCKVPDNYEVRICAAVHEGRVLGATVKTSPSAPHLARCVDKQVRHLAFPRSPRMDVTNTVFYAQR